MSTYLFFFFSRKKAADVTLHTRADSPELLKHRKIFVKGGEGGRIVDTTANQNASRVEAMNTMDFGVVGWWWFFFSFFPHRGLIFRRRCQDTVTASAGCSFLARSTLREARFRRPGSDTTTMESLFFFFPSKEILRGIISGFFFSLFSSCDLSRDDAQTACNHRMVWFWIESLQ